MLLQGVCPRLILILGLGAWLAARNVLLDSHLLESRWRGGRVVEGAALEMLYRGNSIEGSNPSLSVHRPAPRGRILFF